MSEEETHYQPVEITTPVPYSYEFIPIPPPPPPRKRRVWQIVLIVFLAVLISGSGGVYLMVRFQQEQVQVQHDATRTANTSATGTVISQSTSLAVTHVAINMTATQLEVDATTTQQEVDATVTASIPTPAPLPTQTPLYTAQDLYTDFTSAGIGMANEGDMQNSAWTCCTLHPGKGAVQFIDVSSGGSMIAALFNTTSGAQMDAQQAHDTWNYGYFLKDTCLLLYQSSYTNLTPYEQVINQYCT